MSTSTKYVNESSLNATIFLSKKFNHLSIGLHQISSEAFDAIFKEFPNAIYRKYQDHPIPFRTLEITEGKITVTFFCEL